MRLAGVVLAGGRSSRMEGQDKALLALGGRMLVQRAHERLARQVAPVAVAANGDPAGYRLPGVAVVADADDSRAGPLAGVLAGLRWAATLDPRPDAVVSAAVDSPFFPDDLADRLAAAAGGDREIVAVAACGGMRHPTFALWPLAVADPLAAYVEAGGRRAGAFIRDRPHVEAGFPAAGGIDPFFNVNTPADFAAAAQLLGSAP